MSCQAASKKPAVKLKKQIEGKQSPHAPIPLPAEKILIK
jgi:hypothetical protein